MGKVACVRAGDGRTGGREDGLLRHGETDMRAQKGGVDSAIERLGLRPTEAGGGGDCMFLSVALLIHGDADTLQAFCDITGTLQPHTHTGLLQPLRDIAANMLQEDLLLEVFDVMSENKDVMMDNFHLTWVHAADLRFGDTRPSGPELLDFVQRVVRDGFPFGSGQESTYDPRMGPIEECIPVYAQEHELSGLKTWCRTRLDMYLDALWNSSPRDDLSNRIQMEMLAHDGMYRAGLILNVDNFHYQALLHGDGSGIVPVTDVLQSLGVVFDYPLDTDAARELLAAQENEDLLARARQISEDYGLAAITMQASIERLQRQESMARRDEELARAMAYSDYAEQGGGAAQKTGEIMRAAACVSVALVASVLGSLV